MGRAKRKKKTKEVINIEPKNVNKNILGTIKWPATVYSTEVIWFVEEATLLPEDIPVVNVYGNNTAHMIMTYPGLNPDRARQLAMLLLDFANKHS